MIEVLWHFGIGLVVSFIGSIPLGTINISTLQITLEKNAKAGIQFATGATLVELVYSYIAIKFSAFLLANKDIDFLIQVVAIPAFIALGIHSFLKKPVIKDKTDVDSKSVFFSGVVIGLINPLQIPFWVGYGTYMLSKNWIRNDGFLLNFFILGIVVGTFFLLCLVVFSSKAINSRIKLHKFNLNKGIGCLFFGLAIYQGLLIVFKS